MEKIFVKDKEIKITGISDDDYISLTDIAKFKNLEDPNGVIANWMRRIDTIDFLKLWEMLNNDNFKPTEFEGFKSKPGENAFTLSPKRWIETTSAIGIRVKSGKYGGGTFAHKDIALEFASWISAEIKLYIIKEFQRLKTVESEQIEWTSNRILSKINYLIHTDAIKENLINVNLTEKQISFVYSSEADVLNVALFGKTAKEWRTDNPNKKGNMRDYANSLELAILSNLEFHNAKLIEQCLSQKDRLLLLNKEANREKDLFNKNKLKSVINLIDKTKPV